MSFSGLLISIYIKIDQSLYLIINCILLYFYGYQPTYLTYGCRQSVTDRLSLGVNLAFKRDASCDLNISNLRPSLVAKYAGPSYLISSRVSTTDWATKIAFYRHCTDWIQSGTEVDVDPTRSKVTTRLAFRILSDTSVFRAAVDTNGIVSSLWEKRLGDRTAISLSAFLNHTMDNCGVGIGLSFE